MNSCYVERVYRNIMKSRDLTHFNVKVKETDLYVAVDIELAVRAAQLCEHVRSLVSREMRSLEQYIVRDPAFYVSLTPHPVRQDAPPIARTMAEAASMASVGPMAAVAGAFAEMVGRALLEDSKQIIVENGGDIFIKSRVERTVAIFAGKSRFSNRIGIKVDPADTPIGISTSSGTVGPSLSLGTSDATVVIAGSAALADAAATAVGNLVNSPEDFGPAVEWAKSIPGLMGVVIIKGDDLTAWGKVELVEI
ncbi:MAG TPA: UPF0280 family protein [Firmicutes bacterium]|nr:UPF0280 family protein [Bacillota bacterium]